MILLISIRFLFDFISQKYKNWGEGNTSSIYALALISLLQLLNLFTLWILALILKLLKPNTFDNFYSYVLFIILFVINYLCIYRKKNHPAFYNSKRNISSVRFIAVLYVIGTLISFLVVFIYYLYFV